MSPIFEELVAQECDRLQNLSLAEIEARTIANRRAWLTSRAADTSMPSLPESPTPRDAFDLLFFEYLGLSPEELPILEESESEIVWSSKNRCPTLEACQRLQMDTRVVCRKAKEKSTQAFVSFLDPRLRFLRDYREIRPDASGCRERIVRIDFESMMRMAIEEALESKREGNKGYGAVLALGNRVLTRAHDTAATEGDPSLHAELKAIREAARILGDTNLSGTVLFSSCEPCPMCSSLAVWANLSAIVFGASIEKTAARGKLRIMVTAEEIISRSPTVMEVIPGVLEPECLALY